MKLVEPFAARRGTSVPPGVGRRLALDPGKFMGWALFSTTAFLVAAGAGEPPLEGVSRLVIEVPQAYPNSPVPYNDLITLAFLAGRLVGRAQAGAFPVEAQWLWPHSWKGTLPKSVCEARIRRKLSVDERTVMEECSRFVPAGQMNNVWDAVGIGLFAWRGGIS
jgi:hypothetical protein